MKSYRTSGSQVGRHSKKASFRCPLEYARKSRTNPVPYIFKDRIMVKLLRTLDMKESWETISTSSYRCNQSPKKMNEPKLETVASEFLSSETSVSPSHTSGLPALRIIIKSLPPQAILLPHTYGQNSYVTSNESLQLYFQYISPYYSTSWERMGIHYSIVLHLQEHCPDFLSRFYNLVYYQG